VSQKQSRVSESGPFFRIRKTKILFRSHATWDAYNITEKYFPINIFTISVKDPDSRSGAF
jgi:hypothetical protein